MRNKHFQGFTLIELLIVVAIISVLAALAVVAFKPLARFQDSRNAQRWSDVVAIVKALKLYQVDHDGNLPDTVQSLTAGLYYQIGEGGNVCNDPCYNPTVVLQTACVDLGILAEEGYIASIPIDPNASGASADETRYYLANTSSGTLIVGACNEEQGSNSSVQPIEVSY
ncbi:type II secretion system protein [Candidatus Parcubacteria bacterium]|nr:MAG: type II secretion system protein [Candidatus Parcubacteria bacterium]